jgi:glucose-6-phosphate isomerase
MMSASDCLQQLARHAAEMPELKLLARNTARNQALLKQAAGLTLDLRKQPLDQHLLTQFERYAVEVRLKPRIADMFAGAVVNRTEARAALHSWLRQPQRWQHEAAGPMATSHARMLEIVSALRAGQAAQLGLAQPTDIIHLGIGGSDLGPRLLDDALSSDGAMRLHFVSNVDGHALARLLPRLNARQCLLVIVSKSFGTQETLLNARSIRTWFAEHGLDARAHCLAISSRPDLAMQFGVQENLVLPMPDTVGGRYSLWGPVGLSNMLRIGPERFAELLAGARAMDEHFASSELSENLPYLAAIAGICNRNLLARASYSVVPYDERLRLFPAYLQQLEMESLGKGILESGQTAPYATSPVLLPGLGTDSQHAYFQAIHQGTEVVPVDFIGVVQPDHSRLEHHRVLLAHLLAQGAALMEGKSAEAVLSELPDRHPEEKRRWLAQHRSFSGNRPSSLIMLPKLDAYHLGALIALYEHKVFVQSVLWQINAFDQWGVELGKLIAAKLLPALSGHAVANDIDPVTADWLHRLQ